VEPGVGSLGWRQLESSHFGRASRSGFRLYLQRPSADRDLCTYRVYHIKLATGIMGTTVARRDCLSHQSMDNNNVFETKTRHVRRKYRDRVLVQCILFLVMLAGCLLFAAVYVDSDGNTNTASSGGVVAVAISGQERRLEVACADDDNLLPNIQNPFEFMLYLAMVLYLFVCLAIVCDDYFVPALEGMADANHLNLSLDVAGATLMAAGGSAPELFTNLFGTFQQSEVGIGTIVGSAVFNVLFVIGAVCFVSSSSTETTPALNVNIRIEDGSLDDSSNSNKSHTHTLAGINVAMSLPQPTYLQCTPWPIVRDCGCYSVGLLFLAWFIADGSIELRDAITLLLLYIGYVVLMAYNERIHVWYDNRGGFFFPKKGDQHTKLGGNDDSTGNNDDLELSTLASVSGDAAEQLVPPPVKQSRSGSTDLTSRYKVCSQQSSSLSDSGNGNTSSPEEDMVVALQLSHTGSEDEMMQGNFALATGDDCVDINFEADGGEDDEEEESLFGFVSPPEVSSRSFSMCVPWILLFPVKAALVLTIPTDEGTTRLKYFSCLRTGRMPHHICYLQFAWSILWIGVFAYYIVFCTEVLGQALGIPSVVMGLTFVAAGSSVPDLLSSVIVARQGEGNMAISSSIGSNIFDILVGLPLPWIIYMIASSLNGADGAIHEIKVRCRSSLHLQARVFHLNES
jgi:Ca2+/Na+ antiporter